MRAAGMVLAIALALALQTSIARFLPPGANLIDLVFVAVVYFALTVGPAAGLIVGAVAGLAQDALTATGSSMIAVGPGVVVARSIIGIGGLAKTVVGFVSGIVGSQFIVARPLPRAVVFFVGTIAHAIIFVGLHRVLDVQQAPTPYGVILSRAGANAVAGVLVFQIAEVLPGVQARRRSMRGSMRINRRLD